MEWREHHSRSLERLYVQSGRARLLLRRVMIPSVGVEASMFGKGDKTAVPVGGFRASTWTSRREEETLGLETSLQTNPAKELY